MIAAVLCGQATQAHDFERTQVTLTFARDGSFVLDVANDSAWLEHRLIPFRDAEGGGSQPFADRVVLFVDGREVRPTVVERISGQPPLTIYRLRGRVPPTAQSLRWYYGLPIDPYPLTIRRADGRILNEEIAGDAWSRPVDLSGQFTAWSVGPGAAAGAIATLFLVPLAIRLATRRRRTVVVSRKSTVLKSVVNRQSTDDC
ncbi:MAG TPA: hypothetical protein VKE51_23685 [Vicinamibacterales bacterium]|nr:hypothetical protein [Vicinamibacterales bacterium]